ncbi:MAG: hypothetical protein RMK98_07785 [Bacteroidia bacterium]|nr:hypothetical protein [Bacteroidia bacterium]
MLSVRSTLLLIYAQNISIGTATPSARALYAWKPAAGWGIYARE